MRGVLGMRSCSNVVAVYSKAAQHQTLALSSVIMLLEHGILGSCKIKMTFYSELRLHVACRLSELARNDDSSQEADGGR